MALIWVSPSPSNFLNKNNPHSIRLRPYLFPHLFPQNLPRFVAAVRASSRISRKGAYEDPSLLRKPLVSSPLPVVSDEGGGGGEGGGDEVEEEEKRMKKKKKKRAKAAAAADEWVDWEDQILEDTVPLVGFVRMILHSGKYECGDRLIPEHEKTISERLLPYHPEFEKKIGCGIDYITIGFHPEFENSRCMFIVKKDGESVDFSYWKCIKGLIKKNYPLYADSFILRHFKRPRQTERQDSS